MGLAAINLVHAIPGRIRFKVSTAKGDPGVAEEIKKELSTVSGIERVEANPVTGSVLVVYDQEVLASPDTLINLSAKLSSLFPELDLRQLQDWLAASNNGSSQGRPLAEDISSFFEGLNEKVGEATGGADIKVLLPLTLFALGIRGLVSSEKRIYPSWYDLLWFSLGTFIMFNRPSADKKQ